MAVSQARELLLAAAIMVVFALIGNSAAQEAPAPSPVPQADAGFVSPSVAFALVVALFSFVAGHALRI